MEKVRASDRSLIWYWNSGLVRIFSCCDIADPTNRVVSRSFLNQHGSVSAWKALHYYMQDRGTPEPGFERWGYMVFHSPMGNNFQNNERYITWKLEYKSLLVSSFLWSRQRFESEVWPGTVRNTDVASELTHTNVLFLDLWSSQQHLQPYLSTNCYSTRG